MTHTTAHGHSSIKIKKSLKIDCKNTSNPDSFALQIAHMSFSSKCKRSSDTNFVTILRFVSHPNFHTRFAHKCLLE